MAFCKLCCGYPLAMAEVGSEFSVLPLPIRSWRTRAVVSQLHRGTW